MKKIKWNEIGKWFKSNGNTIAVCICILLGSLGVGYGVSTIDNTEPTKEEIGWADKDK